jgi:hypothetical protein
VSAPLAGALRELLDGSDPRGRAGVTLELITVDEDGWPRVALLSAGEVLAPDDATVRLALWPGSRTTANLERDGRALLALVLDGAAHRLALRARRAADIALEDGPRSAFEAAVVRAGRDEVPYARLRSGITFELAEPEQVLARWADTVAALR